MPKDTQEKDLGIWFQNTLKFDEHINYVVNRANRRVGLIKRTFKSLDRDSFLTLYKSLVRSILNYGRSVYYPYTKKNIQLIENIQRRATRILPELKGLSYGERLKSLKLPTMHHRRKRYDLIQLHTCDTFLNPNREIWNFWSGNLCLVSGGFHVANFGPFLPKLKSRNLVTFLEICYRASQCQHMPTEVRICVRLQFKKPPLI